MRLNRCIGYIVSTVGRIAGFSHMTGINTVRCHLVGIHIHKVTEIFVCDRTVVTLQKIVDDIFPIGFYVVG